MTDSTTNRRMFLALLASAFVVRIGAAWMLGYFRTAHYTETMCIAINFAEYGIYSNPYCTQLTGPTAHSTPVFPLLLAALVKLFGRGDSGIAVIAAAGCAASALRCALIPLFMLDAGLGRGAAITAGVLSVLYIGALDTELSGALDGPYVALSMLAIIWMSYRIFRDETWLVRPPWGFYALSGLSVLLNPSVLPLLAGIVVLGYFAFGRGEHRLRFIKLSAGLALSGLVFLLPWGIRNSRALGSFILTRSNLGMELWLSNGDDRTFDVTYNYAHYHPFVNAAESADVAAIGEVLYNEQKVNEVTAWMSSNPGAFARLSARRLVAWWFPPGNWAMAGIKALLTILAFAGLWLLRREHPPVLFALFAVTWLTFPDLYYVIQWSSRMRYPMDWQLLVCASAALMHLAAIARKESANNEGRFDDLDRDSSPAGKGGVIL